ncbi:MAG: hypothetical protein HC902_10655 [Calothrix sp. SM1_5_4]|nr:hypothetical protein [Calothrix sp. SM1_5_4]
MKHIYKMTVAAAVCLSAVSQARTCPGTGDEPLMSVKTKAGPTLVVCGYEDHEVTTPKGKRAFSEFTVGAALDEDKPAEVVFSAGGTDTFWIKSVPGKGFELEELWSFDDTPRPAIWREVTCEAGKCAPSPGKCVLKLKRNPFPKALSALQARLNSKSPDESDEALMDQVWAQALSGDKEAQAFFERRPAGFDAALTEAYDSIRGKLREAGELKCQPPK